ncbi:hypothetical protein [Acinetobacter lwoffii]|uniref:hypothetical protein n=1 Tax=Acinetobacter lwoffii TaxID=28090 RepID=UPI00300A4115
MCRERTKQDTAVYFYGNRGCFGEIRGWGVKLDLTDRQYQVLQCVKDAKAQGKRPYTKGVVNRMRAKGYDITERQCSYDLSVIIRTKGTGVISMRLGSKPTLWIYDEGCIKDGAA